MLRHPLYALDNTPFKPICPLGRQGGRIEIRDPHAPKLGKRPRIAGSEKMALQARSPRLCALR